MAKTVADTIMSKSARKFFKEIIEDGTFDEAMKDVTSEKSKKAYGNSPEYQDAVAQAGVVQYLKEIGFFNL